jgi:SpoVK/Ycf46/Vps4 family AAA+-type ATPase
MKVTPLKPLSQPVGIPDGVFLEGPGRNLDSLVQTEALESLKLTLIREWKLRGAFKEVEQYGIRPTTLSLFYGPPGNGKTMAAKMLANVTCAPLYRVSCEGLLGSYLGQSERQMRDVMAWLAEVGQAVVLFDECESLFRKRTNDGSGVTQAVVRAMQIFWQAVDRWEAPQMFLLATNRIQDIDAAVLSRCETQLEFVGPTAQQAEKVLAYWAELLHEFGAETWSPLIREQIQKQTPASFRELWQMIAVDVRHWITSQHLD